MDSAASGVHVPQHIVAVCALVTDTEGRVLLVRHIERGWEVPGGQVEAGEELFTALQREVREETGVAVSIGPLAGVYLNQKLSIVVLGFLAKYAAGELQASAESPELGWFPRDRVLGMITHPALHDRARDMLEFDGRVVYRAYATDPYEVHAEHLL